MMILKDKRDFYLCDDFNFFYLESVYKRRGRYDWHWDDNFLDLEDSYNLIAGYELGSHEFLFNDTLKFFEYKTSYKQTGTIITPTYEFMDNFKAWAREIKINDILNV